MSELNETEYSKLLYFDKIYPNKTSADSNAASDGVYPGRFILIDYNYNDSTKKENYNIDKETEKSDENDWKNKYNEYGYHLCIFVKTYDSNHLLIYKLIGNLYHELSEIKAKYGEESYSLETTYTNSAWNIKFPILNFLVEQVPGDKKEQLSIKRTQDNGFLTDETIIFNIPLLGCQDDYGMYRYVDKAQDGFLEYYQKILSTDSDGTKKIEWSQPSSTWTENCCYIKQTTLWGIYEAWVGELASVDSSLETTNVVQGLEKFVYTIE